MLSSKEAHLYRHDANNNKSPVKRNSAPKLKGVAPTRENGQEKPPSSRHSKRKLSPRSKRVTSRGERSQNTANLFEYLPRNPPFFVVFVAAFAALILIGTLLLLIPQASAWGESTAFVDALFTAASSVSCTGLIVVDTAAHWSTFGQAVILVLIQLGGFGFMLISAYLLIVLGKHFNLLDFRFSDAMDISSRREYLKFAFQTIVLTAAFEGLGVLLLYNRFSSFSSSSESLWNSVFHSISAFNNAGFNILSGDGLKEFQADNFVLLTISVLVIMGGISAPVLISLFTHLRWKSINLNGKVALTFTVGLLLLGILGVLFMEYGNEDSLGSMSVPQKITNAFFYSVNARTAGFSTLDLGTFGFHTLAFIMVLMFIGGVAGSTAGGIKVNTFATLILTMRSYIIGQSRVHAFGRQIPERRVHEAITVFALAILVVGFAVFILTFTEDIAKIDIIFESVSAFGTVGLTTGITPLLSIAGRLIIVACMFIGRLGPLTIVLAVSERRRVIEPTEPEEAVRMW
ncbi:TrkH family potassium uptake protein [Chloroflexota bacterium]